MNVRRNISYIIFILPSQLPRIICYYMIWISPYIWHEIKLTDIWPPRMFKLFSKTGFGKPIYMQMLLKIKVFPENMGIGLDKKDKNKQKWFWGAHTDPPNLGSAQKSKNLSTLGLYCTVNKTIRNFLLVTIQEPLTRPFQNTPYFSQSDSFFSGKTIIFRNRWI